MKTINDIEKDYRSTWIAIQLALSQNKNGNIIVISSSREGEGVTTTAINLAKIASQEKKTLLIEANINKPSFSQVLSIPKENGITDLLIKGVEIQKILKTKDEFKNLSFITCGTTMTCHHFLTLPAWESFFLLIRESFDVVIIDAPSIIESSDTAILSALCDGLVLVIEADKTRREVIERAKKVIFDSKGKLLGSILNKREYKIPKFIYKRLS